MDTAAIPIAAVAIAITSVFLGLVAAAETALERASEVRIQALASRDDPRAKRIAGSVGQPRAFLGPLTTARVLSAAVIVSLFAYLGAREWSALSGAFGLGMAGGLFVAVVQMTAGLAAARQPERAALTLSGVVRVVGAAFFVPAFILGLPWRLAARSWFAVLPERNRNDILSLVEREEAAGGVEDEERRMIRGIIGLEDKAAREIMVPRIDIAAVEVDATLEDIARLVNERGFSRIPVYRESIDDIVGIAYAKDLLRSLANGGREKPLRELLRPAEFIPETKKLDELLTEMRARRIHMAICVDEYGGVAGLVTIEDLLEEIVGEIEDEYDVAAPAVEKISDDEVVLDASMATDVLRDLFDLDVESEDFDTVGGFVIHELGRLPSVGDEVRVDGLALKVLSMSGRRVRRLRVARIRGEVAETSGAR